MRPETQLLWVGGLVSVGAGGVGTEVGVGRVGTAVGAVVHGYESY